MNNKNIFRSYKGIILLSLLLAGVALLALRLGSADMNNAEFFGAIARKTGLETQSIIIYNIRLPRILGAILAGAGLSVSGALLQSVTNNDLAGPNIIGVNAGAGLFVILLMNFFPTSLFAMPVAAFFGAFLTTLFIVIVSGGARASKSKVILGGIAITALFNAGISFVTLINPDILATYNYFSVGGLSGVQTEELVVPFALILLCFAVCAYLSAKIDTLCLGDAIANSLGINAKNLRIICLALSSACAGAVVSFAGLLGFVGLIVPHIAKKLTGQSMKHLLPVAVLSGSILVLIADLTGRTLFSPTELPVGIVMAFIGAPFFFYLLIRGKNYAEI